MSYAPLMLPPGGVNLATVTPPRGDFAFHYRQPFDVMGPRAPGHPPVRHRGMSAFGAVNLADWWISTCSWQKYVGALQKSFSGVCAHQQRPASPTFLDRTAEQWIAEHCAAGDLVFVSQPHTPAGDRPRIDLYAGKEPLPQGFVAVPPSGAVLTQRVCAGGQVVPQPVPPQPTHTESVLAAACLNAVIGKGDVPLSPPVKDPETGKMVTKVTYDVAKNDCAFVFAEMAESKLPIIGVVALVALIGGGIYFATRKP